MEDPSKNIEKGKLHIRFTISEQTIADLINQGRLRDAVIHIVLKKGGDASYDLVLETLNELRDNEKVGEITLQTLQRIVEEINSL